jgi:hypothetical protein
MGKVVRAVRAFLNSGNRHSAPNSLIIVPCRARAREEKNGKSGNMPLCIPAMRMHETESAEEPVCVPCGTDRSLING